MKSLKISFTTILTLIIICLLSISTTNTFAGGTFRSAEQFAGSYKGRLDGRKASLKIIRLQNQSCSYPVFKIKLIDIDRNVVFYGKHEHKENDHVLRNIKLRSNDGRHSKYIKKWYLHTWNTDYLSGYDVWNNKYYGYAFARNGLTNTYLPKKTFKNVSDFYGEYVGFWDGRKAKLSIKQSSSRSGIHIKLRDLDRNVTLAATTHSIPTKSGMPHILQNIKLFKSLGGNPAKTIGSLLLHTWNTNYLSATSIWKGKKYGVLFVKVKKNSSAKPPSNTGGSYIKEDCISLNPKKVSVKKINGRWKVVDGSHWIYDFNSNRSEAYKTLHIIKYYGITSTCFVGRPNPSFTYSLVNGKSPRGSMKGEDCVSFNPNNIKVVYKRGKYIIVDGNHAMFAFDSKKEANQSVAIIKKYGFTKSCFVGRPNPSMEYLRK